MTLDYAKHQPRLKKSTFSSEGPVEKSTETSPLAQRADGNSTLPPLSRSPTPTNVADNDIEIIITPPDDNEIEIVITPPDDEDFSFTATSPADMSDVHSTTSSKMTPQQSSNIVQPFCPSLGKSELIDPMPADLEGNTNEMRKEALKREAVEFSDRSPLRDWGTAETRSKQEEEEYRFIQRSLTNRELTSYDHVLIIQVDSRRGMTSNVRAYFDKFGVGNCTWIQLDPVEGKFRCIAGNPDAFTENSKLIIYGHGNAARASIGGYGNVILWGCLYEDHLFDLDRRKWLTPPFLKAVPKKVTLHSCSIGKQSSQGALGGELGSQLTTAFRDRFGSSPHITTYTAPVAIFRSGKNKGSTVIDAGGMKNIYSIDQNGNISNALVPLKFTRDFNDDDSENAL